MLVDKDGNVQSRLGHFYTVEQLKDSYLTLGGFTGRLALGDLAEFCGANDPAPAEGDQFKQGRAAGRRDVWLRIQQFLHLTDREIINLAAGRAIGLRGGPSGRQRR